jgi:hypothetical protein
MLCLLSFGLLIPWLGLYADDWTFLWTSEVLGNRGELRYFTLGGNRPIWGLLFHVTIPLIGHQPWAWHLFGIAGLWICAVLVRWLVRLTWPGREEAAVIAAALFAVYPGMQLQFISLTFGHMWLVYAIFLLSLVFSVKAMLQPKRFLIYSVIAILTSAINLLAFEYFIMLELVRPALLWVAIRRGELSRLNQSLKMIISWFPYAALLAGILVWRAFFFVLQDVRYQVTLGQRLSADLVGTLGATVRMILKDIFWETSLLPWWRALTLPFSPDESRLVYYSYLLICLIMIILVFIYLYWSMTISSASQPTLRRAMFQMIATGILAMFMAGWPFWMTGLEVAPSYWNSRFTMPFMLGVSLVFTGLINLIPQTKVRWGAAALLIGMAAGTQFQVAHDFRRDWELHNRLLWQFTWLMPGLEPGTTVLVDDLPVKYFSDNTLSAELNWIAANGAQQYTADYYLGYIREMHLAGISFLGKGLPIKRDMYSIDFLGNTDRVVGIHYQDKACVRLLDPAYDPVNPLLSMRSREVAEITDPSLISYIRRDFILPENIYGQEDRDQWCHKVIKADIARRSGNWHEVLAQGEHLDFTDNYIYRDPMIAMLFIEGLARAGDPWEAVMVSKRASVAYPGFSPVVCKLWSELDPILEEDPMFQTELIFFYDQLNCQFGD